MSRALLCVLIVVHAAAAQTNRGYYRFPAIHNDTIVFTAEGDLWQVGVAGGTARRLTTHLGSETRAAFSPDGQTLAFTADYEGPAEVYTMPASGGLPLRRTFEGGALVAGWTPDGKVLYSTRRFATLPDAQLATIDAQNRVQIVPLSQAAAGSYDPSGKTLFFTRLPFQGSHARQYQGGTAQKLWRFSGSGEAMPLTGDYAGTSKDPMWWNGRVYFLSDRDGGMNLWSMDESGKGVRQHTRHKEFEIQNASLSAGRVVYQIGGDLRLFDIRSGADREIPITLASDFDHLRERWVKTPNEYGVSARIAHDGSSLALISRGKVFVAPAKHGRFVEATAGKPARFRDARLTADGKSLITLSTESGEVEIWKLPANGVGAAERLTGDGTVLRWEAIPSPDGKWIAHQDKDNQLWLLETATKAQKKIAVSQPWFNSGPAFHDVRWSSDSRWLVFSTGASNSFERIQLYSVETGALTPLTSDRYNSWSAAWSADGKWIYFLSDRALKSVVPGPWGPRQPDPYFDRSVKIYQIALRKGLRSPFEPPDELNPEKPEEKKTEEKKTEEKKPEEKAEQSKDEKTVGKVDIDLDGIAARIHEVPVPPGNYESLTAPGKRLCWIAVNPGDREKNALECVEVANKGDKPEALLEGLQSYEISGDGKKMMLRKANEFYVVDAAAKDLKNPKTMTDAKVDLRDWTFAIIPREEFRELFLDAWRLHRDYFYDRGMHGVDWPAARTRYLPLVDRVRDREELSALIAEMVGELSALHTFVGGGDLRRGTDRIQVGALGAHLDRDAAAGGYVIRRIYKSDPDRPDKRSPLARPGVDISEGDVILAINGRDTLSVAGIGELLRNRAGKQVLLRVRKAAQTEPRDVIVKPMSEGEEFDLRYGDWEYTRRLMVEESAAGQIGYLHLRAMGPGDIAQWAEHFYPVFDRQGLIIDVRHNNGGNIDSWILGKLLRKAWFYWQPRAGQTYWNMQYAFRGHVVVLCDERTASDGEAFSEGFRRLGLGKVIGTRTWGGEIWLSGSNTLADRGIATAAEYGVYGPEGKWLIEGHGVVPDIEVDNLPHETFNGRDRQLETAISYLKGLIKEKPVTVPKTPDYPRRNGNPVPARASGGR
jgi:tricorn protease